MHDHYFNIFHFVCYLITCDIINIVFILVQYGLREYLVGLYFFQVHKYGIILWHRTNVDLFPVVLAGSICIDFLEPEGTHFWLGYSFYEWG